MKVLVLGGGGREHALAWRLGQDPGVSEVIVAPGNPGISAVARCVPVDVTDPMAMLALAAREQIDLTVVGPEAMLERGVADAFRGAGRAILGPARSAAALEWSKAFSKNFMARHRVPTARFAICETTDEALAALDRPEFAAPVVVKADGLAAGKGVVVAETRAEAEAAIRAAMVDRQFGEAGEMVVIEECLTGPEVSFFALCDGARAIPLGTAQDHKRIWDDDKGPNTGGMGAFSPSPLIGEADSADIMQRIVLPVVAGMRAEGAPYVGFLYVGLMLTPRGAQVIEFNVRFGDPEAQVVLPRLVGSFADALLAAATGDVTKAALRTSEDKVVGVVMASRGYPASSESGQMIRGLERVTAPALVFHSGTRTQDDGVATAGGRVLTVVGRGAGYEGAMAMAYGALEQIEFKGMQFRKDIGRKALSVTR